MLKLRGVLQDAFVYRSDRDPELHEVSKRNTIWPSLLNQKQLFFPPSVSAPETDFTRLPPRPDRAVARVHARGLT